jgi:hypothetical protein
MIEVSYQSRCSTQEFSSSHSLLHNDQEEAWLINTSKIRSITHEIKGSPLSRRVAYPHPKKYVSIKMTLDNYDGLVDPREHVQNMRSNLVLVIQDSNAICKILPTTFRGSAPAWYNNLKPRFVMGFYDLYAKLVSQFSTSKLTKRSST